MIIKINFRLYHSHKIVEWNISYIKSMKHILNNKTGGYVSIIFKFKTLFFRIYSLLSFRKSLVFFCFIAMYFCTEIYYFAQ